MKHHPTVALSAFLACHAFAQAQPLAAPPREATLPAVSVQSVLWHPRNREVSRKFEAIKDLPYLDV